MMRRRATTIGNRVRTLGVISLATLAALGAGGCASDPKPVGSISGNALTATYSFGTMSVDVARSGISARDVASAAEAMFRRQGYTVRSSEITSSHSRVAGSEVGSGNWQATIVSAEQIDSGVRIKVRVEPFGDESRSRTVINDVLGRLGL